MGQLTKMARSYRLRAEAVRIVAEMECRKRQREMLAKLAEDYDRMANLAETMSGATLTSAN